MLISSQFHIFQSTLPREERRQTPLEDFNFTQISIHAPTRGATKKPCYILRIIVFQSTLPREERQDRQSTIRRMDYFNPRSHERSDGQSRKTTTRLKNFNPRSHERSDVRPPSYLTPEQKFQSTLPREERQ